MNIETKTEIAIKKLRIAWKQAKSKAAKDRITFVAKTLKQSITGALIPLTYGSVKQGNSETVSVMPNFTDEQWYNSMVYNQSLRS